MHSVDAASERQAKPSPIVWVAVAFSFLIGVYKALIWSHGVVSAEVIGYALGSPILPVLIAYAVAGRKKVIGRGYAFATWVAALSIFFLLLEMANARR
jgi:hypothetical protein